MANDSRERMIASAASLIASHGVNATSFSDVVADSGAPRGSIYHHFPDGKTQLAQEAVRWTSARVLAHQAAYEGTTARGVLERFVAMWRHVVLSTDAAGGCVVAGVTVDTTAREVELVSVVRETFRAWVDLLSTQLTATGLPPEQARSVATATLAGMEGALILCRAEGGVGPLDTVAEGLYRLLPTEPSNAEPTTPEPTTPEAPPTRPKASEHKPEKHKKKHKKP